MLPEAAVTLLRSRPQWAHELDDQPNGNPPGPGVVLPVARPPQLRPARAVFEMVITDPGPSLEEGLFGHALHSVHTAAPHIAELGWTFFRGEGYWCPRCSSSLAPPRPSSPLLAPPARARGASDPPDSRASSRSPSPHRPHTEGGHAGFICSIVLSITCRAVGSLPTVCAKSDRPASLPAPPRTPPQVAEHGARPAQGGAPWRVTTANTRAGLQ